MEETEKQKQKLFQEGEKSGKEKQQEFESTTKLEASIKASITEQQKQEQNR